MHAPNDSRRSFLLCAGGLAGSAWLAAHWTQIAAAAHHAGAADAATAFRFLDPAEAARVEAFASQIIPSGATAGAREARVVHFIDQSLTTLFADQAHDFREQLAQFESAFEARFPGRGGFAAASAGEQHDHVAAMVATPFFRTMRFLTVLGFLTAPKYGGNAGGRGWQAIGFEDQHVFTPPFGYYDRDYAGFVPYGAQKS
jgi:Gluconate 2-dehydrogenase subunit 3